MPTEKPTTEHENDPVVKKRPDSYSESIEKFINRVKAAAVRLSIENRRSRVNRSDLYKALWNESGFTMPNRKPSPPKKPVESTKSSPKLQKKRTPNQLTPTQDAYKKNQGPAREELAQELGVSPPGAGRISGDSAGPSGTSTISAATAETGAFLAAGASANPATGPVANPAAEAQQPEEHHIGGERSPVSEAPVTCDSVEMPSASSSGPSTNDVHMITLSSSDPRDSSRSYEDMEVDTSGGNAEEPAQSMSVTGAIAENEPRSEAGHEAEGRADGTLYEVHEPNSESGALSVVTTNGSAAGAVDSRPAEPSPSVYGAQSFSLDDPSRLDLAASDADIQDHFRDEESSANPQNVFQPGPSTSSGGHNVSGPGASTSSSGHVTGLTHQLNATDIGTKRRASPQGGSPSGSATHSSPRKVRRRSLPPTHPLASGPPPQSEDRPASTTPRLHKTPFFGSPQKGEGRSTPPVMQQLTPPASQSPRQRSTSESDASAPPAEEPTVPPLRRSSARVSGPNPVIRPSSGQSPQHEASAQPGSPQITITGPSGEPISGENVQGASQGDDSGNDSNDL